MSVFPQFEQALHDAARERLDSRRAPATGGARRTRLLRARGRTIVLTALALLATSTIALAASGVILTGTPVPPEEAPNPNAGIGVSVHGGVSPIIASAPDPEGGLPWGLRMVRTTRGELCLQIGRVQDDQLGELGIDGAFSNDGRFHPLPTNALPRDEYHGTVFDQLISSATTSCNLEGKAVAGDHLGVDRNADPNTNTTHTAASQLRDLYFGFLGAQAVSVTYHVAHTAHTVPVTLGSGAYLFVHGFYPGEQAGSGGESLGTFGDLGATPPLSFITYRINGRECNRGLPLPPGEVSHLAKPCPFPRWPSSLPEPAMHLPLHISLTLHRQTVRSVDVSLTAPFAVNSARQHYTLAMLSKSCPSSGHPAFTAGSTQSIDRDVHRGERIAWHIVRPTSNLCDKHAVNIEVRYSENEGLSRTIASTTLHAPKGTAFTPPMTSAQIHALRHRKHR